MEKIIHEVLSLIWEKCQCLCLHCKYKIEFGSIKHENIYMCVFWVYFLCNYVRILRFVVPYVHEKLINIISRRLLCKFNGFNLSTDLDLWVWWRQH